MPSSIKNHLISRKNIRLESDGDRILFIVGKLNVFEPFGQNGSLDGPTIQFPDWQLNG
jgi:hypothetical protein